MAIEVRTTRTVRERMADWETVQVTVWDEIERMSLVFGQFAELGVYDDRADDNDA